MSAPATPSTDPAPDLLRLLATELNLPVNAVKAVMELLDGGGTVPFIARYRKEATGGLDEVQIRSIEERRTYLKELGERRATVLAAIEGQGKLTDELRGRIEACTTKQALEDLYLPYKTKRRTKAVIAMERGLGPLAERILAQPVDGDPLAEAVGFVAPDKEVPDVEAALSGARDIVAERLTEDADARAWLRTQYMERGELETRVVPDKAEERSKFEDYYEYAEPAAKVPSHRFLAIRRGEAEGFLRCSVGVAPELVLPGLEGRAGIQAESPWADQLKQAVKSAYRRRLSVSIETDVRLELKSRADREAVDVFAENLEHLLLAAPLGPQTVIGIDPGLRTGCKCAVVDATGRFVETITIFPARGGAAEEKAKRDVLGLIEKHGPRAIAVGNGTGGRETEKLVRDALKQAGEKHIVVVSVSEAGASVYSASDVARQEFPDLDLTIRGAISIARRLQDPLAELVKVDPKSIGVGQYQHDVMQSLLQRKLKEVVESCVNRVGVELNTASASLLGYVAGIGPSLARRIVDHRERNGKFSSRADLGQVSGLGPRTFEQAAGFVRVRESDNPLDRSAVHPERYALVERIAADLGVSVQELVGNAALARRIDVGRYGTEAGELTLKDILAELEKPGRDPRQTFEAPKFRDDVSEMTDLKEGMRLEGVVTNVTKFGAFVDVGVHQDGLVHISQLADHFVEDPKAVVKVGDKLSVRVLEVDLERKRISLSAKSGDGGQGRGAPRGGRSEGDRQDRGGRGDRGGRNDRGGRGGRKGKGDRDDRPRSSQDGGFSNNPFAKLRGKV